MKKNLFAIVAVIAMTACSDETNYLLDKTDQALTLNEAQLEKLEYCGSYNNDLNEEKIETSASEEYMEVIRQRIEAKLNKGGNKRITSNMKVGVVKVSTCEKYDEIHIHYDAEDDHAFQSSCGFASRTSWKYVGNNNLDMYFCVVPADLFKPIGKHYAVLSLTQTVDIPVGTDEYGQVQKAKALIVHMDAEDKHEATKIYYKEYGKEEVPIDGLKVQNYNIGNNYVTNHGDLFLQLEYISADYAGHTLPELGFEYGVFGYTYPNYIGDSYIMTDDEDRNNANAVYLISNASDPLDKNHKAKSNVTKSNVPPSFNNIIGIGKNTTFFISSNQSTN